MMTTPATLIDPPVHGAQSAVTAGAESGSPRR